MRNNWVRILRFSTIIFKFFSTSKSVFLKHCRYSDLHVFPLQSANDNLGRLQEMKTLFRLYFLGNEIEIGFQQTDSRIPPQQLQFMDDSNIYWILQRATIQGKKLDE